MREDATLLERCAGGRIDVAVVLGSGLSPAFEQRWAWTSVDYDDLPGAPRATLAGHGARVLCGRRAARRVAAFTGRVHLYQGFSAEAVTYFVRLAQAAGARTLALTTAAGGLNPHFMAGDLMLIADQLNLTGAPAFVPGGATAFVDLHDLYSERLRSVARGHEGALREGVFAGVRGPYYETPAEARALRLLGADAVSMSIVHETLVARALGLEVLGIAAITNVVSVSGLTHESVLAASLGISERLAALIERTIDSL